ncbi:hypothetical protein ACG9X2_10525 [Acinetobacter bereziniae]|uniref:hypothetical protein n=1 Tax=Acinetobacter bereziniae TaxID=106648 RepID=UPI003AF4EC9B
MNKRVSIQHNNISLQHFCQPTLSLSKSFQKDEMKKYASTLAKNNVEKRVQGK